MAVPVMKPSEALRKAQELLTPEWAWIKESAARDAQGRSVSAYSDAAVCFCSYGAIWHVNPDCKSNVGGAPFFLRKTIKYQVISTWNDHPSRTHVEVLSAFDHAAALAEAQGQ